MSYIAQNTQLLIFLIVLAALLIIVLAVAIVVIALRAKSGRTLTKSTYGNNIEEGRDTGPSRIPHGEPEGQPTRSGVSRDSHGDDFIEPR